MSDNGLYDKDTIVVDADGWTLPRPPRADTEEEPVRYPYVEGQWHRPFLRRLMTACGIPYHSQFTKVEHESLRLRPLCRNCFTIFELAEAERLHEEDEEGTK